MRRPLFPCSTPKTPPSLALFACLTLLATALPSIAQAQGQDAVREKVKLTQQQAELNNKAVLLLKEDPPKAEEAIDIVQAAMRLGPRGDLLVLTLGRAYYLNGQCKEAKETYDQVADAPEVEGLPQAFVSVRLDKYRQQMIETCPGKLAITCSAPDIELTLGDKQVACNKTIEMPAGAYTVDASRASTGAKISVQTNVIGLETTELKIDLGEAVVETKNPDGNGGEGGNGNVGEKVEILPAPKNSLLTVDLGVPFGMCLAQVVEDRGQATGRSICGGVAVRVVERYALNDKLAIGGVLGGSALGGVPTVLEGNYTSPTTGSLEFGGRVWPIPALGIELGGLLRGETISYGTTEELNTTNILRNSNAILFQPSLGAHLDVHRLVTALPPLQIGARWAPVVPSFYANAWSAEASIQVWKVLIAASFERWSSPARSFIIEDNGQESESRDSTNIQERVLLGVSYRFGLPH